LTTKIGDKVGEQVGDQIVKFKKGKLDDEENKEDGEEEIKDNLS